MHQQLGPNKTKELRVKGDETKNQCEILTSVFHCVLMIFSPAVCAFLAPPAPKGEFWSRRELPAPNVDEVTLPNVKHAF